MKVSICVPVYGVEKYIERCAVSLFEQTYDDIEYIFVNDQTPDKSWEILLSVLAKYPQRVERTQLPTHDKNRGSAAVRNTAANFATGDFIMWVDSDDWLELNAVELLVKEQERTGADIVSFASNWYFTEDEVVFHKVEIYISPDDMLCKVLTGRNGNSIWGRLIRRSLYTNNNIKCIEGVNVGEDFQQLIPLIYYSQKVSSLNIPLYNYECRNTNSYTYVFSEEKMRSILRSYEYVYGIIPDHGDAFEKAFNCRLVDSYASHIVNCCKLKTCKEYFNFINRKVREIPRQYWHHAGILKEILFYISDYRLAIYYVKFMLYLKNILKKWKSKISK